MDEETIAAYDATKERARVLADLDAARRESLRTLHAFRPKIPAARIAEWSASPPPTSNGSSAPADR